MTLSPNGSLSVIIVNYNGGDFIQSAIDHLARQTHPADEVIVVDNASVDGSADRLDLSALPNARLIRQNTNLGFAAANNLAARLAVGDWLVLLNPDTEPELDWLEKLAEASLRHPHASMFASAQLDATDQTVLDGAGDCYFILGIPWRGGFGLDASKLPREGECFSPCGASALYRKDIFLHAGGFEEAFFCYCEDVDLGFRLRLMGERCIFVPDAVVRHHGSAISGRYSDFTIRLGTRNRLGTYFANMPPLALALTLPGHALATLYLYIRALGKPHARAMRIGLKEAFTTLPAALRRRRAIQQDRKLSSVEIARAMSWNPAALHGRRPHVWKQKPG